ncbi:hypothetical protein L6R53_21025 [Myxococcota bacterium]|nr:hypothetical protein [Myxococcota bacterium]
MAGRLQLLDDRDRIDTRGQPGCGLGLYAMLLIVGFVAGIAGLVFSTVALLSAAGQQDPRELMAGHEVEAWRLQPMRDAGLLAEGELPLSWHDETEDFSGRTACAMTDRAVLRLEEGQGRSLSFEDMGGVEILAGASGEVVVIAARQGEGLGCRFLKGQGGNRFLRQVQVELLRLEQERAGR